MGIDKNQIERNRRTIANADFETPWNIQFEDSESDIPQRIYEQLPIDKVGLLPDMDEEE